ncbi:uncharacterized protein PV07_04188 [Cladophialophora immunda]|uniref:Ribosome maturation protein SDO1/SBDS N-terminal domain-containing protein n=1 Tax=Cladophialophora immunda TaxID=569365 RepID=A0A0D2DAC2_9EURO|nr:uncharacterized protein PV07_04188 [Cladophialophora immunda]KIW32659.1 hypothetical protein PV07_04188 [Cladophialophora immunda]OQV03543.1 hypothetical protein CLAIMM_08576 [Cladophialophora immunda]
MPGNNDFVSKVHFKGKTDSFIIFVESPQDVERWREDKSISLTEVVKSFKIMVTHKHGAQGHLDGASKASLENEFGTSEENEVIKTILMEGKIQDTHRPEKWGTTNETMGAKVAHHGGAHPF